jgi:hypothetical protein
MQVLESELKRESALLALVDDNATRVLCSTAVPLQHLVPGVHYNLKLAIAAGAVLLVTVLVESAPMEELQHMQQVSSGFGSMLLARLAACSVPMGLENGQKPGQGLGTFLQFWIDSSSSDLKDQTQNDSKSGEQEERVTRQSNASNLAPMSSKVSGSQARPSHASTTPPRTSKASASAAGSDSTLPPHSSSGRQTKESPHLQDWPALSFETVYIEANSQEKDITTLLERRSSKESMLQGSSIPIVGTQRPDQQLWPISHGILQALPKAANSSCMLMIILYQLHLQGTSKFLGCCRVPLSRLVAMEDGSLEVLSDLSFAGGPRVSLLTSG